MFGGGLAMQRFMGLLTLSQKFSFYFLFLETPIQFHESHEVLR